MWIIGNKEFAASDLFGSNKDFMALSVNKITLLGNLTRDAETKFTPSGVACTKITVATSRSWKDKQTDKWIEEAQFTSCVLWRKESLAQHLLKGVKIYVEGRLQTRNYEDKDGRKVWVTEVVVDEVVLLDKKSGAGPSSDAPRAASPRPDNDLFDSSLNLDEEVPF